MVFGQRGDAGRLPPTAFFQSFLCCAGRAAARPGVSSDWLFAKIAPQTLRPAQIEPANGADRSENWQDLAGHALTDSISTVTSNETRPLRSARQGSTDDPNRSKHCSQAA